jgi:hypothetical protein
MLTDAAQAPSPLRPKTHKQKQKRCGLGWAGMPGPVRIPIGENTRLYPFTPGQIDPERIKEVIAFNIAFMDRFFPAIMAVIYTAISPKRAHAMVDLDENQNARKKPVKKPEAHDRFLNN